MKVLIPKNLSMDSKLTFTDRMKVLYSSDLRKDPDPYVFCEPEPVVVATGGKNIKLIAPKNCKLPNSNKSRSKKKCVKQKNNVTNPVLSGSKHGESSDIVRKNANVNYSYKTLRKERPLDRLKRLVNKKQKRDHTLQYYARAGDEITDSDSSGDEVTVYQRCWYMSEPSPNLSRDVRLQQLRFQLQRQLTQLQGNDKQGAKKIKEKAKCLISAASKDPTISARILNNCSIVDRSLEGPLIVGNPCQVENCSQLSLPCTQHCSRHIMFNTDQLLFEHCTAKFSDNTQCSVPVFDVTHELPLCLEHARKRDNYHRRAQESKPKKTRKKPEVLPTTPKPKPKSRPKKKKKSSPTIKIDHKLPNLISEDNNFSNSIIFNENHTKTLNNLNIPQGPSTTLNSLGLDLGLGSSLKVDDNEVFASLDPTEHDFGNVLNNLPADAFNDLFIESRNCEYEPSPEEEEELERALEAVNKDVRNLERMGQSHGLLEPGLLAQLMSDIAS